MSSETTSAPGRRERLRFGLGLFLLCDGLFFVGLAYLYLHLRAQPALNQIGLRYRSAAAHGGACIFVGLALLFSVGVLILLIPTGSYWGDLPGSAAALAVLTAVLALHLCVAWFWTARVVRRAPDGDAADLAGLFLLFVAVVGTVLAALPK
jgi:heme/copper-type cytochrome/quinol oxidase subunit 3